MTDTRFSLVLDGTTLPSRERIGGKAWSVARMRALGLPVPPAFVLTTDACRAYFDAGGQLPPGLMDEVRGGIAQLEAATGRRFGGGDGGDGDDRRDDARALLVSVRSGAPVSMPGMMDTVLNLGICDAAEAALARETGSDAFARDTRRRFLDLFARIVLRAEAGTLDPDASVAAWQAQIARAAGAPVPDDPWQQLEAAIRAVFDSWHGRRAKRYREHHGIAHTMGTAVTVQAMVFGNSDARSGTGVLFSRNPLSGDATPYGEYLACAQGEDVVSGSHTPQSLDALARALPDVHAQLLHASAVLERENRDVQDIEFTVERGRLHLLQSRSAKRSPAAAVRCAVDLVDEGCITPDEALTRVSAEQVRLLLRPRLADGPALAAAVPVATGEAASPGVGVGVVVADADSAEAQHAAGAQVVLARPTTSPEDVHGMLVACAVITERGGSTSHAAVVSRQLGVPCVVGCGDGALAALTGRTVTVDGTGGRVFDGALPVEAPDEAALPALARLRAWAEAALAHDGIDTLAVQQTLPALLAACAARRDTPRT
jgi:pyruvate,orthophosphate dikinase